MNHAGTEAASLEQVIPPQLSPGRSVDPSFHRFHWNAILLESRAHFRVESTSEQLTIRKVADRTADTAEIGTAPALGSHLILLTQPVILARARVLN